MLNAEKEFIREEVGELVLHNRHHHELAHKMYQDLFNHKQFAMIPVYFAPEFYDHKPFPGQGPGRESMALFYEQLLTQVFPDLEMEIRDLLAEGDRVMCRYLLSGTHLGAFAGIPASGRQLIFECVDCLRYAQDQIIERWSLFDFYGLMQQLELRPMHPPV